MPAHDALSLLALMASALFIVILFSLMRLTRAGLLAGRRADGSPSLEAIAHSIVKLILVIVLTVAFSRVLLAPRWPGGPFAPDLSMVLASGISLVASFPAVASLALLAQPGGRHRAGFIIAIVTTWISSGIGQVIMSGVAAGRDLADILALAALLPVIGSGFVSCVGLWLHGDLVKRITVRPTKLKLQFADAAYTAATTFMAVWLACLGYSPSGST